MKAHYRSVNGRVVIEVEGETVKALFKQIAAVQEVFDADTRCGVCQSEDIQYRARRKDDFDFYELICICGAELHFGQHKVGGGLFAKRTDDRGLRLDNRGWKRFIPAGHDAPRGKEVRKT